jgi:hypothetical protein
MVVIHVIHAARSTQHKIQYFILYIGILCLAFFFIVTILVDVLFVSLY